MSNQPVLKVSDFTKYPGPRYKDLGPSSGEEFREKHLIPMIEKYGEALIIDLDGVMGYGSSFLEESFGGAVRVGGIDRTLMAKIINHVICEDEPTLKEEILGYVQEAGKYHPNSGLSM